MKVYIIIERLALASLFFVADKVVLSFYTIEAVS